ncbi:S8 family peptidase [uncultured Stenotrophomonas sp.]|uniref:S8 family peptidase n=1 Tax=uncultured Stenotrophomonas sp. TaxID=165438 RepID=UPI0028D04428|nr:S8 family peptidase [uncultured Stenotrophomonas sp.]
MLGEVSKFSDAVRDVPGLEWIDEEDLAGEPDSSAGLAYLMVPDARALAELTSLWSYWKTDGILPHGLTKWSKVFSLLADLRPWGPRDRVDPFDAAEIELALEQDPSELLRLELELVYRRSPVRGAEARLAVEQKVMEAGGRIIGHSRIDQIHYDALLVELPRSSVSAVLTYSQASVAGADEVMHIRPQAVATSVHVDDEGGATRPPLPSAVRRELGEPILALLDGVPMAGHSLLSTHLSVDDVFELEPTSPVSSRVHGTAMASLLIHGDLGDRQSALPRRIHTVPVIHSPDEGDETFPSQRLLVDVIYQAVVSMREGEDASSPHVLIINLSLGNRRARFHGRISPWARLLDYLAYRYGILFVVSAGNTSEPLLVADFAGRIAFEDSSPELRARSMIKAVGGFMAQRTIISPAESVNSLTVGASNEDSVSPDARSRSSVLIDPYASLLICNPSSTLGPGYSNAVKPDVLMPGGKERVSVIRSDDQGIWVEPGGPGRSNGLKVARPPVAGVEASEGYTTGTSASAALVSRTCHRIHDALERAYGEAFLILPSPQRAVLLKVLLAHAARWPAETVTLIQSCLGPEDRRQHVRRKDNVRRFIGYGVVDAEAAVTCADDRATVWATGLIGRDQVVTVSMPIPSVMGGKALPHEIVATLGWFTPVIAGARAYRSVRLWLAEPDIEGLGIKVSSDQPDTNQARRGTLYSRRWDGRKVANIVDGAHIKLNLQRQPDQDAAVVDDLIPFAIAITVCMPDVAGVYEEVRQRLEVRAQVVV